MFFDKIYDKKAESPAATDSKNAEAVAAAVNTKLLNERMQGVPSQADITLIGDKASLSSIIILLSYLRHYISTGEKGEINVKVGFNKPANCPFTFSVNDQLVDDIYPGPEIEVN